MKNLLIVNGINSNSNNLDLNPRKEILNNLDNIQNYDFIKTPKKIQNKLILNLNNLRTYNNYTSKK